MFESIQLVLELKRRAEVQQGAQYSWVLLLRHDIAWQATFIFSELHPRRFYVANSCDVSPDDRGSRCRALVPSITPAVDFYFAANSSTIDRVFLNVTRDIEHFCFYATRASASNHKVIDGRLISLGLWPSVDRYLYHHFDVSMLRNTFIDHGLPCALYQAGWHLDPARPVVRRLPNGEWHSALDDGDGASPSLGNLTSVWQELGKSPRTTARYPAAGGYVSRCPSSVSVCGCSAAQAQRAWQVVERSQSPRSVINKTKG